MPQYSILLYSYKRGPSRAEGVGDHVSFEGVGVHIPLFPKNNRRCSLKVIFKNFHVPCSSKLYLPMFPCSQKIYEHVLLFPKPLGMPYEY